MRWFEEFPQSEIKGQMASDLWNDNYPNDKDSIGALKCLTCPLIDRAGVYMIPSAFAG